MEAQYTALEGNLEYLPPSPSESCPMISEQVVFIIHCDELEGSIPSIQSSRRKRIMNGKRLKQTYLGAYFDISSCDNMVGLKLEEVCDFDFIKAVLILAW